MAWINCKQPLSGKLVTQEEKEQLLEERKNGTSSTALEISVTEVEDITSGETEAGHRTVPDKEENELTADNDLVVMSSDNESDQELLIISDNHTHK